MSCGCLGKGTVIFIPSRRVMGGSGTGKSTVSSDLFIPLSMAQQKARQFVNNASGGRLLVGSGLESCTKEVTPSPSFAVNKGRKQVTLFDTPGFNDTIRSDVDILQGIATFLVES